MDVSTAEEVRKAVQASLTQAEIILQQERRGLISPHEALVRYVELHVNLTNMLNQLTYS